MDEKATLLEILRLTAAGKSPDHLGDLIKIGLPLLGVVVAAVVGYFTARRTAEINRQTQNEISSSARTAAVKSDQGERRAAHFETLTTKLDAFIQALTTYATHVKNVVELRQLGSVPATRVDAVTKSQNALFDAFPSLLNVESRLLLLGHAGLQRETREFGERAQALYRTCNIDRADLTVEKVEESMDDLRKRRLDLLTKIGEAERDWWRAP